MTPGAEPETFRPRTDLLPKPQQEIWPLLAPAPRLSFVLYRGTAVALHLGHRRSLDFDFFRSEALDKSSLRAFAFIRDANTIQEDENTVVAMAAMPSGPVKVSFFGGMTIGRVNDPLVTTDSVLLVASIDDLLATKLKAILDRAEARDYQDIAAMLSAGASLERALGAFSKIWRQDPALPLKALGYFKDGDLPSLPQADQALLRAARDRVQAIPDVALKPGLRRSQVLQKAAHRRHGRRHHDNGRSATSLDLHTGVVDGLLPLRDVVLDESGKRRP
jgi:hypothetical protein